MHSMRKIIFINILAFFLFAKIPVDGVVATVEDKMILKSDVVLNMQMAGVNLNQNSIQLESVYNNFLTQMINDYVLIAAAEKDTNIIVDDNMVDMRLTEYMNNLINELGSEQVLSEMFNKPFREIKYYYQEQIYNAMLRDMYVYTYVDGNDISRKEVELFYESYKDSLPTQPAQYTFSIIEEKIIPNAAETSKIYKFQESLKDSVRAGQSFGFLAKTYSQDLGTAEDGGNQGYYNQGTLFPEFEKVAFNLQINEISNPVRTPLGFHLIQLLDKKQNQIHTRHILSLVNPTQQDLQNYKIKFNNIYNLTKNDPGLFDSLAVEYSNTLDNFSGVYRKQNIDQVDNYFKRVLLNSPEHTLIGPILKEKNEKYILVYINEIQQESNLTLKNAWLEVEMYAKMKKENDLLMNLIEKLKHNTFIKYYK